MAGGFNAFKLKVIEIQGKHKGGGGGGKYPDILIFLNVDILMSLRLGPTWRMTNGDVQS